MWYGSGSLLGLPHYDLILRGQKCTVSSRHEIFGRQERTVIHYENNWIQLKELYREQLGENGVKSSTFVQPS